MPIPTFKLAIAQADTQNQVRESSRRACGGDSSGRGRDEASMRKAFIAVALVTVVAIVAGPATAGGNGRGGGKGGGKPSSGGGTISLVLLESTDGLAHHGQDVTFNVSTTATDRPFVALNCYQDGVWVYAASAGFFPDYPWSTNFTLSNDWFTSAGDCSARLYMTKDGSRSTTLATLDFHVYA
jgi:hypothetical protein